jgi:hypothetical protein
MQVRLQALQCRHQQSKLFLTWLTLCMAVLLRLGNDFMMQSFNLPTW